MLEGWEGGWKKAWIMIVCARGARRNRVWDEMQPHLHRDATASAPRHVRTRGWVRQESVGHGSSTSQPYTPCMAGGTWRWIAISKYGGCVACKLVFKKFELSYYFVPPINLGRDIPRSLFFRVGTKKIDCLPTTNLH